MSAGIVKRAYLDTNVLVEYAWDRTPSRPRSRKRPASELIRLGLEGRFDICISTFCIIELYEHFRDWYLMRRMIADGFGYREFRRERRRYKLTDGEAEKLEMLTADFRDKPNVHYVDFTSVPDDFFPRLGVLQRNGLDCLDAFHILIALDVGATHLVTKDGEMRSRFDRATRRGIVSPPMEVTSVRGFLKRLGSA